MATLEGFDSFLDTEIFTPSAASSILKPDNITENSNTTNKNKAFTELLINIMLKSIRIGTEHKSIRVFNTGCRNSKSKYS